jgi:hypothetical protein
MQGINCWEFKKCLIRMKCPAYPNDGNHCWYIMDTLCVDKQGCQIDKLSPCMECSFYKKYKKR